MSQKHNNYKYINKERIELNPRKKEAINRSHTPKYYLYFFIMLFVKTIKRFIRPSSHRRICRDEASKPQRLRAACRTYGTPPQRSRTAVLNVPREAVSRQARDSYAPPS